jgi:hypothetical protein
MTRNIKITIVAALAALGAASASFAEPTEPTDRSRPVVSPPTGAERTTEPSTRPYALTGSEAPKSGTPTGSMSTGWRRSVQRLGGRVEIDRYER